MLEAISPDPVALQARLRPGALACADIATGRRWSYRALDEDIRRAITLLQAEGLGRGDRLAVVAKNSACQIVLQMALMRMGAIFVPLNWRLSRAEIGRLLADCTPRLLLTDETPPDLPEGCRLAGFEAFTGAIATAAPAPRAPPHDGSACCLILYTSGTSGVPKGAMISAQALLATAINFGVLGEVDETSIFLCDSPMFHVIGAITQIWPALLRGGACVVSPGFVPEATNERIADPALGISHYFCVPQMAEALRQAPNFDPARWQLKALFTGGAPNPPSHIRWWLDQGIPMVDGYGMTEAGTILGMPLAREVIREKAGAVGLPGPLTAVRLVDAEERAVADGAPGEILVAGPSVIRGYWNRPEERASAFTQDGWLRTGDIGRRDAEGFIFILDRRKDMFISGGENIYPVEVEAALITYPSVREVAVIGMPDDRWGEVGCAFLVAEPGQEILADELAAHCRDLIASFKVPRHYRLVDSLPRTGSGKVMKHLLRDCLA